MFFLSPFLFQVFSNEINKLPPPPPRVSRLFVSVIAIAFALLIAPKFAEAQTPPQPITVTPGDGSLEVEWALVSGRTMYDVCFAKVSDYTGTDAAKRSTFKGHCEDGTGQATTVSVTTTDTEERQSLTLTATDNGIENGVAYFIAVVVHGGSFAVTEHAGGNTFRTFTPVAATAPNAPTSATAARGTDANTVDVTWVPASGGVAATGFEICVSHFETSNVDTTCGFGRLGFAAAGATTFTAKAGLDSNSDGTTDFASSSIRDNEALLVAVRAITGAGAAMKSAWTIATPNPLPVKAATPTPTPTPTPTTPTVGNPVNPTVVAGEAAFTVNWTPPMASATVLTPTGYEVCYGTSSRFADLTALRGACDGGFEGSFAMKKEVSGATSQSLTLSNSDALLTVTGDIEYRVAIRSLHGDGNGDWIATDPATITPTPAVVPTPTMFTVAQVAGTTDVTVSWDWAQGDGLDADFFTTVIYDGTNCVRSNNNASPDSGTSYSLTFDGATVTAPGQRNRLTCNAGSGNDGDGNALTGRPILNSFEVGTEYTFRVRGIHIVSGGAAVTGEYTADQTLAITEAAAAPGAPTGVMAIGVAAATPTLRITWVAPDGGTTPEGYEVCVTNQRTTNFNDTTCPADRIVTAAAGALSRDVSNAEVSGITIAFGSNYAMAVRATHTTNGDSDWVGLDITTRPSLAAALPVISLMTDKTEYTERTEDIITVTLTANPAPTTALAVDVLFSENRAADHFRASQRASSTHIDTAAGTITFVAGEATASATWEIHDDRFAEEGTDSGGALVAVQDGAGYTAHATEGSKRIHFLDNDFPAGPPTEVSVAAGANAGEIVVSWVNPTVDSEGNTFAGTSPATRFIVGYRICVAATATDALANMNCLGEASEYDIAGGIGGNTPTAADSPTTATLTGFTAGDELFVAMAVRNHVQNDPKPLSDFAAAAELVMVPGMGTVTPSPASSDASLSSLSLRGVTLSPAFVATRTSYTATVDNDITTTTITATPASGATVTGDGVTNLVVGPNRITVTVTAADGTTMETYTVTVTRQAATVTPTEDVTEEPELPDAAKESLPSVTRAVTGQIANAISGRINSATTDSFNGINLASLNDETTVANFLKQNKNSKNIFINNDFVLPLNATENASGLSSLSLWASGGIGGINGDENTTDWNGDYTNANLGLDAKVSDDLLIGLALSKTQSEIDYKDSDDDSEDGKYELNLTTLHPYFAWQSKQNSLWASIGGGNGEIQMDEQESIDAKLKTYSIGLDTAVSTNTKIKTEITQSELKIDNTEKTKTKTKTAKLQLASNLPLTDRTTANIAFGISNNSGDDTNTAFELTTGLTGGTERLQLSADLQLKDNARQWGISGSIRIKPGNDGQGLSLSMQPQYNAENKMQLTTNIAYKITEVTPYAKLTTNKNEYGMQWQPTKQVKLKLQNEKTKTDNAIKLTAEINF